MELTPELQIQAVLKALNDTILPALDPDNAMANEQGQLAAASLQFLLNRLPLDYDYARAELRHWLELAGELLAIKNLPAAAENALREAETSAAALMQAPGDNPQALRAEARALRAAVGALVDAVAADQIATEMSKAVQRAVLAAAESQIQRERAWLAPLGVEWEAVADIADMIGPAPE